MYPRPNRITAANVGWRTQSPFCRSGRQPGVAEFYRSAAGHDIMEHFFLHAFLARVVVGKKQNENFHIRSEQ